MTPDKAGIWEWFEEDGTTRLVCVCVIGKNWLKVYWWGGYYNVNDDVDSRTEWPDRWGKYVGPLGSVEDKDLYLLPTPEQREKILKQNRN